MKKFTLFIYLFIVLLSVPGSLMAQSEYPLSDAVYRLFWEADGRGYLTYHQGDYPGEAKLSGVTYPDCSGLHYATNDAGIATNWYLVTSEMGFRYLFEASTGKFISIGTANAGGNNKVNVLDTNTPCPITFETPVCHKTTNEWPDGKSGIPYQLRAMGSDGLAYWLCSGCGTAKSGHPVRWEQEGSSLNLNDGGFPVTFVKNATATVSSDILNAAKATIANYEATLLQTIQKAQSVITETGYSYEKSNALNLTGKLSSNAAQNDGGGTSDGGGIDVLTDGTTNNYFHTRWGGTTVNEPHHIQVDLGEGVSLSDFYFEYTTRNASGTYSSPCPLEITVYGSNDGNATNFTKLALLGNSESIPQYNVAAGIYRSPIIQSLQGYRYLRFAVTRSEGPANELYGGQYFFGLSEFCIYNATVSIRAEYQDFIQSVKALNMAIEETKQNKRNIADAVDYINEKIDEYYEELRGNAANFVDGWDGVGYPVADAIEEYLAAVEAAEHYEDITAAQNALLAADIQMPENGKAYTFTNVQKNGTEYDMGYNATEQLTFKSVTTPAVFICRHLDGNKYAFVDNNGHYLIWKGRDYSYNSNGYTDTYDSTTEQYWNDITIAPMQNGGNVSADSQLDLMGFVTMQGRRNDKETKITYFVIKNGGDYDAAGAAYYNDDYSSAFRLREASYANTPQLNSVAGSKLISGADAVGKNMATFSAPFPTLLPEGVSAYYAESGVNEDNEVRLTEYEGAALPANQGFILVGDNAGKVTMVPAAGEEATAIDNNLFGHSAGAAITLVQDQGYLLAGGEQGPGFYACNAGTLAMNKAYLAISASAAQRSIVIRFPGTTDIDSVVVDGENIGDALIYDLSGRRVERPSRGIYIVNGKKMYLK